MNFFNNFENDFSLTKKTSPYLFPEANQMTGYAPEIAPRPSPVQLNKPAEANSLKNVDWQQMLKSALVSRLVGGMAGRNNAMGFLAGTFQPQIEQWLAGLMNKKKKNTVSAQPVASQPIDYSSYMTYK
jgi:hypothetical protein